MTSTTPNPHAIEFLRRELIRGASCQGGHSDEGQKIARLLGIPFPLRMANLARRARELGLNPADLWPWYSDKGEG